MPYRPTRSLLVLACALLVSGCGPGAEGGGDPAEEGEEVGPVALALGPADGHELPPADLDRVTEGDPAPDFTLASLDGDVVTLSELRAGGNVVLVFYRGHW